jgi:hypothetical protein
MKRERLRKAAALMLAMVLMLSTSFFPTMQVEAESDESGMLTFVINDEQCPPPDTLCECREGDDPDLCEDCDPGETDSDDVENDEDKYDMDDDGLTDDDCDNPDDCGFCACGDNEGSDSELADLDCEECTCSVDGEPADDGSFFNFIGSEDEEEFSFLPMMMAFGFMPFSNPAQYQPNVTVLNGNQVNNGNWYGNCADASCSQCEGPFDATGFHVRSHLELALKSMLDAASINIEDVYGVAITVYDAAGSIQPRMVFQSAGSVTRNTNVAAETNLTASPYQVLASAPLFTISDASAWTSAGWLNLQIRANNWGSFGVASVSVLKADGSAIGTATYNQTTETWGAIELAPITPARYQPNVTVLNGNQINNGNWYGNCADASCSQCEGPFDATGFHVRSHLELALKSMLDAASISIEDVYGVAITVYDAAGSIQPRMVFQSAGSVTRNTNIAAETNLTASPYQVLASAPLFTINDASAWTSAGWLNLQIRANNWGSFGVASVSVLKADGSAIGTAMYNQTTETWGAIELAPTTPARYQPNVTVLNGNQINNGNWYGNCADASCSQCEGPFDATGFHVRSHLELALKSMLDAASISIEDVYGVAITVYDAAGSIQPRMVFQSAGSVTRNTNVAAETNLTASPYQVLTSAPLFTVNDASAWTSAGWLNLQIRANNWGSFGVASVSVLKADGSAIGTAMYNQTTNTWGAIESSDFIFTADVSDLQCILRGTNGLPHHTQGSGGTLTPETNRIHVTNITGGHNGLDLTPQAGGDHIWDAIRGSDNHVWVPDMRFVVRGRVETTPGGASVAMALDNAESPFGTLVQVGNLNAGDYFELDFTVTAANLDNIIAGQRIRIRGMGNQMVDGTFSILYIYAGWADSGNMGGNVLDNLTPTTPRTINRAPLETNGTIIFDLHDNIPVNPASYLTQFGGAPGTTPANLNTPSGIVYWTFLENWRGISVLTQSLMNSLCTCNNNRECLIGAQLHVTGRTSATNGSPQLRFDAPESSRLSGSSHGNATDGFYISYTITNADIAGTLSMLWNWYTPVGTGERTLSIDDMVIVKPAGAPPTVQGPFNWEYFVNNNLINIDPNPHRGTASINISALGATLTGRSANYQGVGLNVQGLRNLSDDPANAVIVVSGSIAAGSGSNWTRLDVLRDGSFANEIQGNATSVTIPAATSFADGTAHRLIANSNVTAPGFTITDITVAGVSVLTLPVADIDMPGELLWSLAEIIVDWTDGAQIPGNGPVQGATRLATNGTTRQGNTLRVDPRDDDNWGIGIDFNLPGRSNHWNGLRAGNVLLVEIELVAGPGTAFRSVRYPNHAGVNAGVIGGSLTNLSVGARRTFIVDIVQEHLTFDAIRIGMADGHRGSIIVHRMEVWGISEPDLPDIQNLNPALVNQREEIVDKIVDYFEERLVFDIPVLATTTLSEVTTVQINILAMLNAHFNIGGNTFGNWIIDVEIDQTQSVQVVLPTPGVSGIIRIPIRIRFSINPVYYETAWVEVVIAALPLLNVPSSPGTRPVDYGSARITPIPPGAPQADVLFRLSDLWSEDIKHFEDIGNLAVNGNATVTFDPVRNRLAVTNRATPGSGLLIRPQLTDEFHLQPGDVIQVHIRTPREWRHNSEFALNVNIEAHAARGVVQSDGGVFAARNFILEHRLTHADFANFSGVSVITGQWGGAPDFLTDYFVLDIIITRPRVYNIHTYFTMSGALETERPGTVGFGNIPFLRPYTTWDGIRRAEAELVPNESGGLSVYVKPGASNWHTLWFLISNQTNLGPQDIIRVRGRAGTLPPEGAVSIQANGRIGAHSILGSADLRNLGEGGVWEMEFQLSETDSTDMRRMQWAHNAPGIAFNAARSGAAAGQPMSFFIDEIEIRRPVSTGRVTPQTDPALLLCHCSHCMDRGITVVRGNGDIVETIADIVDEGLGGVISLTAPIPDGALGKVVALLAGSPASFTLNVATPVATMSACPAILTAIYNQMTTGDASVEFNAGAVDIRTLNEALRNQIGDRPVFEFMILVDGVPLKNFGGGTVTVSIPYTLSRHENPHAIFVNYINPITGELELVRGSFSGGFVTFTANHFSQFIINHNPVRFVDTPDAFRSEIMFVGAAGLMQGVGDGFFNPEGFATREQVLVMMMRAAGISPATDLADNFDDAGGNRWYSGYVARARQMGIVGGIGGNRFGIGNVVTNAEALIMIYNVLEALDSLPVPAGGNRLEDFADADQLPRWVTEQMRNGISLITEAEIYIENELNPTEHTQRQMLARLLFNLMR